jgi:competence protein ComEA
MFKLFVTPFLALGMASALLAGRAPQHPINLNTATTTELLQLPRVGIKSAERIIAFRKQHGGFQRVEEIMNVKGIGEKSFVKLKPYLTVGPSQASKTTQVPASKSAKK